MNDIIHLLPDSIANQIAAGEVIQRPASVVKELVENAIDAGATSVRVQIKDAGRTLIQVIDNGKGMSEADARMAFERHATSKISTADDLFTLHTMGFRGEALASIAAVAHVELLTRLRGTELGTHLILAGSELDVIEPVSCAEGSIFSVKNLFFNVPARRKFLKSNEVEFRHIITEFERIALVNPQVAFALFHNDVEVMNLPASLLLQRILHIYGKGQHDKLLPVEAQSSLVTITGFAGRPDATRKRSALQYFFVNGRFMKHPFFHKAVMQAYEQLIPVGDQPHYFLYFTLDPACIDVNIHPTKTEIKFENEQPIWQILVAAVRETLAKSSAIPTIDFDREGAIDIPVYPSGGLTAVAAPRVQVDPAYNPFDTTPKYKRPEFDWSKLYEGFEGKARQTTSVPDEELVTVPEVEVALPVEAPSAGRLFSETSTSSYQYKGRYIITSIKSGLAIIDQHRAHLRILFDQYMQQIRQQKGFSQQVLFPEVVQFTPAEASMLPCLWDDLHFAGFDLSDLGQGSYAVNGLPVGLEQVDMVALLKDIVSHAIETGRQAKDEICSGIALSLAKAAAIRPGKFLSAEEMEHLIASLFSSADSNLTPDGKTILTLLTEDELDRRFR